MKKCIAVVLTTAVAVFLLARWSLGDAYDQSQETQIHEGTVDTYDADAGVACLSSGASVDCYPSAVGALRPGQTIHYSLTAAIADPRREGSGYELVITWIELLP